MLWQCLTLPEMRVSKAALEMLLDPVSLRDSQPAFPSAFTLGADLNVSFNWKCLETWFSHSALCKVLMWGLFSH